MATQAPQSYENHRVIPTFFYVNALMALAAAICAVVAVGLVEGRVASVLLCFAAVVNALAIAGTVGMSRLYALTLQDRIVRLEMQVRLARILPEDLQEAAQELHLQQLIGLRFASDAEMPALVRQVLDEKITSGDAIKRLVKDWQADHQRV